MDLLDIFEELRKEIVGTGIRFNKCGYPIFPEEVILKEEPEYVLPFRQRSAAQDKSRTVLCFFDSDKYLYSRLLHYKEDASIATGYLGVCGFDLSPRINLDIAQQRLNILLSQLYTLYLGTQGIPVLPNFRAGNSDTFSCFQSYPTGINYAVGTLGCARGDRALNDWYLRQKILITRPRKLFFYGTLHQSLQSTLLDFGIDYRVYMDYKRACFAKGA